MRTTVCAAAVSCGLLTPGLAADRSALVENGPAPLPTHFYAHFGPAGFVPDAGASIKLRGAKVPGASIRVPATATAAVELGYRVTPNWAVSLSTGVPPRSEIFGTGTIARLGKLGSTVAGPMALTAHYHLLQWGAFQPYIGGGVGYLIVFGSKDAAMSHFRLANAVGAVGQIGTDIMITDRVGLFLDAKKAYLRTSARGLTGGLPTRSNVKLDPLALTGGVVVRF